MDWPYGGHLDRNVYGFERSSNDLGRGELIFNLRPTAVQKHLFESAHFYDLMEENRKLPLEGVVDVFIACAVLVEVKGRRKADKAPSSFINTSGILKSIRVFFTTQ